MLGKNSKLGKKDMKNAKTMKKTNVEASKEAKGCGAKNCDNRNCSTKSCSSKTSSCTKNCTTKNCK